MILRGIARDGIAGDYWSRMARLHGCDSLPQRAAESLLGKFNHGQCVEHAWKVGRLGWGSVAGAEKVSSVKGFHSLTQSKTKTYLVQDTMSFDEIPCRFWEFFENSIRARATENQLHILSN